MIKLIRLTTLFLLLGTICLYAQVVPVNDGGGDPPPPDPGTGGTTTGTTGGTTFGFVCSTPGSGRLPFHAIAFPFGPFSDIGTGADGSVWAIGPNGARLVQPGGGILSFPSLPAIAPTPGPTNTTRSRIAVGIDGSPWIVNDNHNIYHLHLQTGQWELLPGLAVDIAVTSDGTTWVIGTLSTTGGFHIYLWNGSSWVQISPGSGVYIAGGPLDGGQPWVTNSSNQIYHRNPNGTWTQVSPGLGHDIAVDFANGSIWTLGTNGIIAGGFPIWHFMGSWTSDPNITGAISIAGYCGGVFFIDGGFNLWQLQTS